MQNILKQILGKVERDIGICMWRADELFAKLKAKACPARHKLLFRVTLTKHDILRAPSSIIVLSVHLQVCFHFKMTL